VRLAGVGVAGFDRHKQLVLPGTEEVEPVS